MVSSESDDSLEFLDEADSPVVVAEQPWLVLIVDDDEEVHSVTRLALDRFTFRGRPLTFASAHSGSEAIDLLRSRKDVAVVLLDVVMETDDAGLKVVQFIRDTAGNNTTRIILRTGQPGQAPEHDLIVRYDINDYKSKTELTLSKLYTMMVSSLRSYEQIVALETSRLALERILEASADLFRQTSMEAFADGVLTQIGALLSVPVAGILCLRKGAAEPLEPVAASGVFAPVRDTALSELLGPQVVSAVDEALSRELPVSAHSVTLEQGTILTVMTPDNHSVAVWLQAETPLDARDIRLIERFCVNISIGFDRLSPEAPGRQAS